MAHNKRWLTLSDLTSDTIELLKNYRSSVLLCVAVWLAFALAETFKTLYFAYNKLLYLHYLSQSLYIFLPWILFSIVIGLALKRTYHWHWARPRFLLLHGCLALAIVGIHLAILASSYLLFTPSPDYDIQFFQLYERLTVSWFNYELLSYVTLAIMWHYTFTVQQGLMPDSSLNKCSGIQTALQQPGRTYTFNTTEGLVPADITEVEWLLADNNYTDLEIQGRKLRVRCAFRHLLKSLNEASPELFIQTHRSAAVNIQHIERIEKSRVVMRSGSKVPVSRRRYRALRRYRFPVRH